MKKYSVHHGFPLSLGGIDDDANKERMLDPDHILLHKEQNLHHSVVRRLRKQINDVLIWTPSKLGMIHGVQRKFFDGVVRVPDRVIIPQTNIITKMIRLREYQIKSILGQIGEGETYSVDEKRKEPPMKGTRKELIDENKQKLEKLFEIERDRARAGLKYVKKAYEIA